MRITRGRLLAAAVVIAVLTGTAALAASGPDLGTFGVKKRPPADTSWSQTATIDSKAVNDWTAKATTLLNQAKVKVTVDGEAYKNEAIARSMYGRALQKEQRKAMETLGARFNANPDTALQDPMKTMPPPSLTDAPPAVAAVVLNGTIWLEAKAGGREAPEADAKALTEQSRANLASVPPEARAMIQTQPGETPEQAMTSPRAVEVARQNLTVKKERDAIVAAAPAAARAATETGDPVAAATARTRVLADWLTGAVQRHRIKIVGLGTFGPTQLPSALSIP